MNKLTELLGKEVREILSEESISNIENALTSKIELAVEAALTKQDDLYSKKLKQLIEAIDKDHTAKLKKVVAAIDKDNSKKLVEVIKKYEQNLTSEAKNFKNTLVESISNYLEEFLDEAVPTEAIAEATRNKTATKVLSNLRKVLAVDTALMKESIQDALADGRDQIDTLREQVEKLSKENQVLKESYLKTKSALILEAKTAGLSDKKKEYIRRVLGDKSPKFIEENLDYTLRLFDKKEQEKIEVLKEEAFKTRQVKVDAPVVAPAPVVQKESKNPYLVELERIK